mmetsp:Transcript_29620/g.71399  ORF Transcript_29620/g.71399 Transcript_29620/m.71399 type:complete len:212 (+) Transcript_29620:987-1622(+)
MLLEAVVANVAQHLLLHRRPVLPAGLASRLDSVVLGALRGPRAVLGRALPRLRPADRDAPRRRRDDGSGLLGLLLVKGAKDLIPLIARVAEDLADQRRPVAPPRRAPLLDGEVPRALLGLFARGDGAALGRDEGCDRLRRVRLGQGAPLLVPRVARVAQHAALEGAPVLAAGLVPLVDQVEVGADLRAGAALEAALLLVRREGLVPLKRAP